MLDHSTNYLLYKANGYLRVEWIIIIFLSSFPFPDIKIGVGVDLVWDFGGKGYIGATISLIGGVDITDGVIIPLPDFQINPVSGCYGVCMFGDCKAAGA